MRKIITIGILFVMLAVSACQNGLPAPDPAPQAETSSAPAAVSSAPAETPAVPEDLLLRDYVRIYEKYCRGAEFTGGNGLADGPLENFLFGWMLENDLADRYAVYSGAEIDYYTVPGQDADAFRAQYFADDPAKPPEPSDDLRYDAAWADGLSAVETRLSGSVELPEGGYRLTVQRFQNGREWYPAEYVFEAAPNMAYRFVSVENLPLDTEGNSGDVIAIRTPRELSDLSALVNSGDRAYQDNVYHLAADLDMTGLPFEPIGAYAPSDLRDPAPRGFSTTFDGRGHAIKNLTVKTEQGAAGLFACVGLNGFVTNLRLENCNISSSAALYGEGLSSPAGGIAGELSDGVVSRCAVAGTVSGTRGVGGLAGLVSGASNVQESTADVRVSGNKQVGGAIGGAAAGQITGCTASGQVKAMKIDGLAPSEIGGFVGENTGAAIDRGIVSVEVRANARKGVAGSFAGANTGKLVGCFYNSDISQNLPTVGGAAGGAPPRSAELIGLSQKALEEMGVLTPPAESAAG